MLDKSGVVIHVGSISYISECCDKLLVGYYILSLTLVVATKLI